MGPSRCAIEDGVMDIVAIVLGIVTFAILLASIYAIDRI